MPDPVFLAEFSGLRGDDVIDNLIETGTSKSATHSPKMTGHRPPTGETTQSTSTSDMANGKRSGSGIQ